MERHAMRLTPSASALPARARPETGSCPQWDSVTQMLAPSPAREARLAAGLSQAQLAVAAGVSRQTVGAIEAGRHRPSVDAALAIAEAVGRPIEQLFGASSQAPVAVLGRAVAEGAAVLAARVGPSTVYAPAHEALAMQGWPQPNAVLRNGAVEPLPDGDLAALVIVGCDPAIGLAAAMLPASGARRLIALSASTAEALAALRAGRTHAAVVHNRPDRLPRPPVGVLRLHLARWSVGVASAGGRARTVAELCASRARVVQRDDGASSQKAFLAAVTAEGCARPEGPVASGHLEVARRVAFGADAGVTMEPAAVSCGLAFDALEEHVAEIWVHVRAAGHPGVQALGELLRSHAFTARLSLIGGYDLSACGSVRGQAR